MGSPPAVPLDLFLVLAQAGSGAGGCGERLGGDDGGMGVAVARRLPAGDEGRLGHVDEPGAGGSEEGDLDPLAGTGPAALVESGEDGDGGVLAGQHVDPGAAGL